SVRVVNIAIKNPSTSIPTPGSAVKRQFPDNTREHIRHCLQRIGQELFEPGNAYCWPRGEIGLINGHDHNEISCMSQQGPVLKTIQTVIVIMVAEFVDEGNTIYLMQGFQSGPYSLVVLEEELLNSRIVMITCLHIHYDPIVVSALNLVHNGVNKALVGRSFINIFRLLLRSPGICRAV